MQIESSNRRASLETKEKMSKKHTGKYMVLTIENIINISKMLNIGLSAYKISKMFEISKKTVLNIKNNKYKSFVHVPSKIEIENAVKNKKQNYKFLQINNVENI